MNLQLPSLRFRPDQPLWQALRAALRRAVALTLALVSSLTLLSAPAQVWAQTGPGAVATPASAPALKQRPLRSDQPPAALPPTMPGPVTGPPGALALSVVPRQHELVLFPCSQCHKVMPVNTTPRQLMAAPHAAALNHGQGRMWCLDCHQGNDRDVLHGIGGKRIDFNGSSALCAQCHSSRHRDWVFGAHGKRVADWQGTVRSTTARRATTRSTPRSRHARHPIRRQCAPAWRP